jgi:hypothetical protein
MKIKSFVSNTEDNLHCFQACFKMAYETLLPSEKLDMPQVDLMTNYLVGYPTWPFKGMLSLAEAGLFVINIEKFPFNTFLLDPKQAIQDHVCDEEIAAQVISLSNLDNESKMLSECMNNKNILFQSKIPDFNCLQFLLNNAFILIVNINYWSLLGEDRYAGHFVIVEDITSNHVKLQNPGLPAIQNQLVSHEEFIKSWHYPTENIANVIAISNRGLIHNVIC